MHKFLGLTKFFAAGAIVMAAAAGCGGSAPSDNAASNAADATPGAANTATSSAGEAKVVRVGYSPNIVQPQPVLLKTNPAYTALASDVKIEFKAYQAGPAVIEALRAGVIDVGYSGVFPALKAYNKAGDILLVAGAATGGTELSVAKNSPIKAVKDLKGKTVGVNQLGSTVDAMVRSSLLEAGLVPDKDVKIKPIEPAMQADALKTGLADAVAAPAPWPSAVQLAGGHPLRDWKQIFDNGNYSAAVLYTTKKFAADNPEALKAYANAHRAVTDKLNQDRAKGDADVLAGWAADTKKKLSPEIAKAAFATIKYTNDPDPRGVEAMADLAVRTGVSKKKGDLSGFIVKAE